MYKDKFVLSIIHDGHPVKETGSKYRRKVALPFGSEYKIRLKNKNDRSCTARVFIDNKKVSALGDFIISPNGVVDLERFVDASLASGKKFKFVSLDHPEVDDPTSSENGVIKVEFRLAKASNGIKIKPDPKIWDFNVDYDWDKFRSPDGSGKAGDSIHWRYYNDSVTGPVFDSNVKTFYTSSDGRGCGQSIGCNADPRRLTKCSVSPGATIEGGYSNQRFSYSEIEVGGITTVLKLKIVGINDVREITKFKYCTYCGNKIKRTDKYCAGCGRKL